MKRVLAIMLPLLFASGCFAPVHTQGAQQAAGYYDDQQGSNSMVFGSARIREGDRTRASADGWAAKTAPETLELSTAIRRSKEISARIRSYRAMVEAAEAAEQLAAQPTNPELQITQVRVDQWVQGEPQVRPMLHFTVNRPGEIDARVATAKANTAQAKAYLVNEEIALENEISWLYEDAFLVASELHAAQRRWQLRVSLVAQIKAKIDSAQATQMDGSLAELSELEAEQDVVEKRTQYRLLVSQLLERLGWDPDAEVKLAGESVLKWKAAPIASEKDLVHAALRNNQRIVVAAARIDGASARLHTERAKRWPWLTSVEVGYQFAPGVKEGLGWVLQAGIEIPLFHTNSGGVAAATAMTEAERESLVAETERVTRDVREKLREVQGATKLASELLDKTNTALDKAQGESQKLLDGRTIDVVRALMIEERRVAMEERAARVIRRYRTALFELKKVIGGRMPEVGASPLPNGHE